jgi:hypothetical protein
MTWYINKGDDLIRSQTVKFPFFRSFDEDFGPSDLIMSHELIECLDKYEPIPLSSIHPR